MSTWYDHDAERYRSSLPHKFFYVWTWPITRWVMHHCMPPEAAHYAAIHLAIPFVGFVDRWWSRAVSALVVWPAVLCLVLLCRLMPRWFYFDAAGEGKSDG